MRRPRPWVAVAASSPAQAVVAVIAGLSGSAVALPGKGSVDSGDLKDNTIRSQDLRNGHVRGVDVRNNTLTGDDVQDGTLTGSELGGDAVTGAQVDERTLARVPSAATADHAATADSAATAGSATTAGEADIVDGQHAADLIAAAKPLTASVGPNCGSLRRGG